MSEPEHLVGFCERIPGWCLLVALIGSGQAIHVGEEGDVPLWLEAARSYLRERYADARFARYGLVASSKDMWLPTRNRRD